MPTIPDTGSLASGLPDAFSPFFSSTSRLYRLQAAGAAAGLLVESWSQREALSQPWELQISTLSTNARLDIQALLGQKVTLLTKLADGRSEHPRSGIVTAASALAADGGFARYQLTVQPWLALLAYGARSAVWQEKSLPEIVDSVFGAYSQHAAWAWSPCAQQHLAQSHQGGHRSYTVQYRESDLAFVSRLLAREGLVYRFENDDKAQNSTPLGHKLVILADTSQTASCPEDPTSAASGGIRFHRASSQEQQDAIQVFGGLRQLQAAVSVTSVWDYKRKGPVTASVPTVATFGGGSRPAPGPVRARGRLPVRQRSRRPARHDPGPAGAGGAAQDLDRSLHRAHFGLGATVPAHTKHAGRAGLPVGWPVRIGPDPLPGHRRRARGHQQPAQGPVGPHRPGFEHGRSTR